MAKTEATKTGKFDLAVAVFKAATSHRARTEILKAFTPSEQKAILEAAGWKEDVRDKFAVMNAYATRILREFAVHSDVEEIAAISAGCQAFRDGWEEQEITSWLQTAYNIWVREAGLKPTLSLSDVREKALQGYAQTRARSAAK